MAYDICINLLWRRWKRYILYQTLKTMQIIASIILQRSHVVMEFTIAIRVADLLLWVDATPSRLKRQSIVTFSAHEKCRTLSSRDGIIFVGFGNNDREIPRCIFRNCSVTLNPDTRVVFPRYFTRSWQYIKLR